jgi:radical SAM protein with 4Fe4S-binding SPASM domain
MKVKKFHQLVILEKGPINTAIVDLLKGNLYQIGNEFVEKFNAREYHEIPDFIRMLEEEQLCFEVNPEEWVPYITFEEIKDDYFCVQIEEENDINRIRDRFSGYNTAISVLSPVEKDFSRCRRLLQCNGDFPGIDEADYHFNRYYNSCWGKKIVVMKNQTARPCIHSRIILGRIFTDDIDIIVERARKYWKLTKDKVEKCKDCELRYACFDCREIAMREGGEISSANPYCRYDPYRGNWASPVSENDQQQTYNE